MGSSIFLLDLLFLDAAYEHLPTVDTHGTTRIFGNLRGDFAGLIDRAPCTIALPGVKRPPRGINPRLCA
jgi:hypothetical protein